ncbi:MAG: hypothetical protein R6U98_04135, partial [Pirellulaceae bacterium]
RGVVSHQHSEAWRLYRTITGIQDQGLGLAEARDDVHQWPLDFDRRGMPARGVNVIPLRAGGGGYDERIYEHGV